MTKNNFIIVNQSVAFVSDFTEKNSTPNKPISIDPKQMFPSHIDQFDLGKAGIVQKAWELAEKPQIDLPFLSRLNYDNGISFTAEINRLVFFDSKPKEFEQEKNFFDRSLKLSDYIDKIGIKISAIGTNFGLILPTDDADRYVYESYLNKQVFSQLQKSVKTPNLRLSYDLEDDVTLNLNIFSSSKDKIPGYSFAQDQCVVLDANFDYKIGNIAKLEPRTVTSQAKSRFDLLKKLFQIV